MTQDLDLRKIFELKRGRYFITISRHILFGKDGFEIRSKTIIDLER